MATVADVRLLARDEGPEAIKELAKIMRSPGSSDMAKIAACNSLLDRGWGRPAVQMEILDVRVNIDAERESALEFIAGKLADLEARSREGADSQRPN